MDLAFNAEELAFQKEVRDWITANMPPEVAEESRRSRAPTRVIRGALSILNRPSASFSATKIDAR